MNDATTTELTRDEEETQARAAAMTARMYRRLGLGRAAAECDELAGVHAGRAADVEWLSY